MKNWIANEILKRFYRGYLIAATFPYTPTQQIHLTIDLGRLVAGEDGAVEYDVIAIDKGYLN